MGLGRPISRILLYPAIHLRGLLPPRAPLGGAAPTSPATLSGAGTIWLARTGGLPGRSLAGYRRWALTPPFHPSPVPDGVVPRSGHRLVCSLLHLTWRRACALPPLGFLARAAFPGAKNRTLASPDFALRTGLRGQDHSDGSDGPDLPRHYTPGTRCPPSGAGPGGSRPRGG